MGNNFLLEANRELFESWCKCGFQLAGHYDFSIAVEPSWIIESCREAYGIDICQSDLDELCKQKLIDFTEKENGEKSFPLFIPDRIDFIKKVQKSLNFSTKRLQQIITYEDYLIRYIETDGELCYEETKNMLEWYRNRIGDNLKADRFNLGRLRKELEGGGVEIRGQLQSTEKRIELSEKMLLLLSNKKLEDLSAEIQQKVKESAFTMQFFDEIMRKNGIASYYRQILQGYSPHVEFSKYSMGKEDLNFNDINWKWTLEIVEGVDYIDFFRTPFFMIEMNGKEIDIKIMDLQKVDAGVMRMINKIYTIFRERAGNKKKAWGENSGRKIAIQQRDDNLRKLYAVFRKEKPRVASWRLVEQLEEYSKKIGLPVSAERIKRIIYCSKNKSKTPANNSS